MSDLSKKGIQKILNDKNHPHTLSLDANDIFFLNDKVVVTEGQEDVIGYKKLFAKFNLNKDISFFGWGAGSADKIEFILQILYDLGYKKIFVIL